MSSSNSAMAIDDIYVLLDRSDTFHNSLRLILIGNDDHAIPPGDRTNAAFSYGRIALEHGSAFQHLLAVDNPAPALALVRLQYEAVLRGSWILYAAPATWLEDFKSQGAHGRKETTLFPKVFEMLDQLDMSPAESVLPQSLRALKDRAWDALNSYTHGGLRLMVRALDGFEPALLMWMLRTTNSLCYVAAQLICHVANDPARSNRILDARNAMPDCMHPQQAE